MHYLWEHTKWRDGSDSIEISRDFKNYIENTVVFRDICRLVGSGVIMEGLADNLKLKLDKVVRVEKAEDLPIELIQHFYENSPFYKQ